MIDFEKAKGLPQNELDEVFKEFDKLRDTIDVEQLLNELGIDVNKDDGEEWVASCPLPSHGGMDANPSFAVNPTVRCWNCFKCGGGNLLMLTKEVLDCEWKEALAVIRPFTDFGMDGERFAELITQILMKPRAKMPEREPELPWYPSRRLQGRFYGPEVEERGISRKAAEELDIGVDRAYQSNRGYVGPAIVIPHRFKGQLTGWQARLLGPTDGPRHDNSSDLPKRWTLYGYDQAQGHQGIVFVVESPMTVARLRSAGYLALATFGATLSPYQIKLLRRFPKLALAFDNDSAGRLAEKRVAHALDQYCTLWITPPVPGEKADLGDLLDDGQLNAHIAKTRLY